MPILDVYMYVASFADAWIETAIFSGNPELKLVASFADAWIETHPHL